MGWFSAKNIASVVAAPMTGGASLLFADVPGRGSVMGELTGENSAKEANRQNIKWQNYWNDKSIELANTAHQREVADLKAAGLNPILSAGGSGATTPGFTAPQVQNTMPGGYLEQASKVMGLMSTGAQASNLMTNSALQQAQTAQTNLDTAIKYDMAPSTVQMAKQNVKNAIAQEKLTNAQTTLTGKQLSKIDSEIIKNQSETRYNNRRAGGHSKSTSVSGQIGGSIGGKHGINGNAGGSYSTSQTW